MQEQMEMVKILDHAGFVIHVFFCRNTYSYYAQQVESKEDSTFC
jgi:hypothetical protein